MAMTDDAALLAELRTGHPEAARALYDTYGPCVYAFARRRTGDAELSREIVQDVMTNVWRSAERFDSSKGSLRAWVFQIARNATIDAGRKKRSRPTLVTELPHVEDPTATDDLEVLFRSWLIAAALERLHDDHRAVIELVYFQQLKVAEAADLLGLAEGTVKSRCFYAMQNLRTAFHELGVIDRGL